jgi:hypothetical protein
MMKTDGLELLSDEAAMQVNGGGALADFGWVNTCTPDPVRKLLESFPGNQL